MNDGCVVLFKNLLDITFLYIIFVYYTFFNESETFLLKTRYSYIGFEIGERIETFD